ncbi:MAG: glycosyltransferase family 2 protein [Candidatus Omnitrophica bacterium]|nr:glycosyltransferase family 2 protein [Candidatus Omnitrophota bacterium]
MLITVIIPAYNEEKRLVPTLEAVKSYFSKRGAAYEVVLVDDGSTDNTVKLIEDKHPWVNILSLEQNSGKGKAVREGMLAGKGDYLLFMDADSSTSIEEFEKFLPQIQLKKDIIMGTRKIKGAEIIEHQLFFREFFGKGFTWLSNLITQAHVSDFTCGFKCFSRKAANDIFSKAVIDDWSFDAEILFLAKRLGYEITEVPVIWKNDRASKVRLLHDIMSSLKGLLLIRLNALKGLYR